MVFLVRTGFLQYYNISKGNIPFIIYIKNHAINIFPISGSRTVEPGRVGVPPAAGGPPPSPLLWLHPSASHTGKYSVKF